MKNLKYFLFLICFFIFFCGIAQAQVVINEISSSTDNDDWIEIYAYEDVNLTNYRLTHIKSDGSEGDINIPSPLNIGPNSTNGSYKVIEVNNYLGNAGDRIRLYQNGNSTAVSDIPYGNQGGVCVPSVSGSIARIPNGGNTIDRLAVGTKGSSNGESVTDPCPSPTPAPTNTPTNSPTNTPTPTTTPTIVPTFTPTSTPKPTAIPTKRPTTTPKDYSKENASLQADVSKFRYDTENNEDTQVAKEVLGATDEKIKNESISPFAYVLLALGLIFVGISVFFFIKNKKENTPV